MTQIRLDTSALDEAGRLINAAPGEMQREIAKQLRGPAMRAMARQRAKIRGLQRVPTEWKDAGAQNLRVEPVTSAAAQGFSVLLRRSSDTRGPWLANRGWWYHPTYGKPPEVRQETDPAWFDGPARASHPDAIRAAGKGLEDATRDLAGRIDRLA